MNIKTRILLILLIASLFVALATGSVLILLIQLHGQIDFAGYRELILAGFAVAVYLTGGLFVLAVLSVLLNQKEIIHADEQKFMEKEKEMLSEQFYSSQDMDAVGQLANSIAHDFNNLLTIIDGYSSLIISNPSAKETKQNAKEVVKAARKASFITRKLLSFSHKNSAEPVILDINTTLADTDKMISHLMEKKFHLVTRFSKKNIYVKADPVQLGKVLMNLAVNAQDAMPNGGRITIKTDLQHVKDGEFRKPDDFPEGDYAKISFRDTGKGIAPEEINQIFDPFFTTKEHEEGAVGLGLSIVNTIVKQAGGFIDVVSKVGAGTTFMIYLPVVEVELDAPGSAQRGLKIKCIRKQNEESEDALNQKVILLVEDDLMIRELVTQTLEDENYKVLVADDGWDAVQIARKYDGSIDLLFTDVVMPGLGGAELATAVSELHPMIKLLFMSGYSRSQITEEGVPADAKFLEKPFVPDKAVSVIQKLFAP